MSLRFVLGLSWLMVCSNPPSLVRAQDPAATSSARTLFEQGLEQVDQREWIEAAHSFRQALLLRDSPVIRYNLAVALIELHALAEAERLLRGVQRDITTPVEVRAKLTQQLQAIERRAAKLTVRIAGASDEVEVSVDDRVLPAAELGSPQRLDPGPHTVRLHRAGQEIDTHYLELAESVEQVLVLSVPKVATPAEAAVLAEAPPAAPVAAVAAAAAAPPPPPKAEGAGTKKRRRWLGIGAGVLAVTAGSVTGIVLATRSQSSGEPHEGDFNPPVIGVRVPQ